MNALQDARDVMLATEENTGLDASDLIWMFAQAQAYAAIATAEAAQRQAAAAVRIADALYVVIKGEEVEITDVLLAIQDVLEERKP